VGLNTCLGEGFGLCNLEHACIGKPQIVSKVGALADIFTPEYATLIKPKASLYLASMFEDHQGYIHICDSEDFVAALDTYYDDRILASWHGTLARDVLTKKYEWETILAEFNAKLLSL
jgi:glycosyltransferase involved in cell wall biosynthesis